MKEIKTYHTGLVESYFTTGEVVDKYDILCDIFDLEGNKTGEVISGVSGTIICDPINHFVTRGSILYLIQP